MKEKIGISEAKIEEVVAELIQSKDHINNLMKDKEALEIKIEELETSNRVIISKLKEHKDISEAKIEEVVSELV